MVKRKQMKIKRQLRTFHRWIGLTSAIWLLLLATTGLLLQHSDDWKLDQKYITSTSLLNIYGIGDQYIAFDSKNHQLQQLDKQIIQDGKVTQKLEENIIAAIYYKSQWIIATNTEVIWVNNRGQISKSMDELDGLTFPIKILGKVKEEVVYKYKKSTINLDTLEPINLNENEVNWSKPSSTQANKENAIQLTSNNYLNYEKVISDIHAGITTSSIINDIAAIALIILSLSGIILFFRKKKTNR